MLLARLEASAGDEVFGDAKVIWLIIVAEKILNECFNADCNLAILRGSKCHVPGVSKPK